MEKDEMNGMSAENAAKFICKVATKNRVCIVNTIGFKYKLCCFLVKILPATLLNYLIGKIYAK